MDKELNALRFGNMKLFLTLLSLTLPFLTIAQIVSVKRIELMGEKVIIHYDLEDANTNHEFQLHVFTSKDNFTSPLANVTGDIGSEVKPGANKKIIWDIAREYGAYKGRISVEVRGKVHVPLVKFQNFNTDKSYKRGRTYHLALKAGSINPIHVELLKGNERITGEMNYPNSGSYALSIPSNAKRGDDYRLKITDSRNNNEVIYSPFFKVRPKLPLLVKVLPIVVIGGGVAALAGSGSSKGDGTRDTKLPDPPAAN